ncbi:MAG: arginine deiminase [Erysipelotrichaceae bacterium]|nr:arginine deiminase [Erysipelotrichaceae bacterium]
MKGIHVTSEIKPLKKVLLHRPGNELLNLTPDTLEELLFDDIPFLKIAQQEHDAFAKILRDNGVEVVYLENLVAEVFDLYPEVREQFLRQFLKEANITGDKYTKLIIEYLNENYPSNLELVLKTMEGMRLSELPKEEATTLIDRVENYDEVMLLDPLPNLYFQRDPFASVGNGVLLHKMYSKTRSRETIYDEYVFKYHPDFKDVPLYYSRNDVDHIEGGDVLNLNESTLAIGISQRTNPDAIERTAKRIFADENSLIRTIYAFHIPKSRAFMHLDTVFTQIDYDKFTYHPAILGTLQVFKLTPGKDGQVDIEEINDTLQHVLEKALNLDHVELIPCGGGDMIAAAREQWNDGSNTLCIAPGVIVVYERNDVTNEVLRQHGLKVLEMPSCELSRGRGGPRCMSMPLIRED